MFKIYSFLTATLIKCEYTYNNILLSGNSKQKTSTLKQRKTAHYRQTMYLYLPLLLPSQVQVQFNELPYVEKRVAMRDIGQVLVVETS